MKNVNFQIKQSPMKRLPAQFAAWCAAFACALFASHSVIAQDAVYQLRKSGGSSKVDGSITKMTPFGITIDSANGTKEIPAAEIGKFAFDGDPIEVSRARSRIDDGRYDDALTELAKISQPPKSKLAQQEIAYLNAFATAMTALRSGDVTAQAAGQTVKKFVTANPQNIRVFPATELLGKLLFAIGRPELAEKEFQKLTQSKWPEMELRGNFYRGEVLNVIGKHADAIAAYDAILAVQSNDDMAQRYKLLARVQKAKSQALAGKPQEAIPVINEIIKVENPEKEELFAYIYNALGTAHLKSGNLKEAALAFMHTELLFAREAEPHAEALFNLAQIWPKLEMTDRASRAREGLKSSYRNSYWASKL